MTKHLLLAAAFALLVPRTSHAVTRNVPADFSTIQAALNASTYGDVVLVAPGTYFENIAFAAGQSGVKLQSTAGPDVTMIDGGRLSHVVSFANVGPSTELRGFTLKNGGESPLSVLVGGAVIITNCSPTIADNVIRDNQAVAAGGLYVDGGAPTIVGNRILANRALGGSGGGVYFDNSAGGTFEGNIVAGNECAAFGGGITCWVGSTPNLTHNTVVSNQGHLSGGGIYVVRDSHATCDANIVAFNSAGGGIVVEDPSSSKVLSCSDTYANTPANYLGLSDPTGANGNISQDPLFCDLSSGDYGLTSYSPCAPANAAPACGQIGARGVTCSPTNTERASWGGLKAKYLSGTYRSDAR